MSKSSSARFLAAYMVSIWFGFAIAAVIVFAGLALYWEDGGKFVFRWYAIGVMTVIMLLVWIHNVTLYRRNFLYEHYASWMSATIFMFIIELCINGNFILTKSSSYIDIINIYFGIHIILVCVWVALYFIFLRNIKHFILFGKIFCLFLVVFDIALSLIIKPSLHVRYPEFLEYNLEEYELIWVDIFRAMLIPFILFLYLSFSKKIKNLLREETEKNGS